MRFNILNVSSVSACFELESTTSYYAPAPYDVTVNSVVVLRNVRTNVFSLFSLTPDTDYIVSVRERESISASYDSAFFRTRTETACICVTDFGAKGDGITDDTLAIQSAINVCPAHGRVTVPKGTYSTGPILLKSDLTLELQEGSVLLGVTDEEKYPVLPGEVKDVVTGKEVQVSSWEGNPFVAHQSFISAWHAKNIQIVGQGVIDGNAQNSTWWINPKQRAAARPKLVFLNHCEDVTIHGILGRNSASWNFHPFFSKHIDVLDIAVEAPKNSPNTDGFNPESCTHVRCIGTRFSVGDDAIAIKSGKMYMGMKYQTPASNHLIRNCLMEFAHGAVVLGSEMSGGIKNLSVSQCLFSHTDRGLRIKTRRGRGKYAVIDGVEFSNIIMDNVMTPLVMNMYYFCDPDGKSEFVWSKKPLPVDDTTPYLGRFTFRDMECRDCEWSAGFFYGLPEQPIGSVTIENVNFTFKKENASFGRPAMMDGIDEVCCQGLYFNCVKKVHLKNVQMSGQVGERVMVLNVEEAIDD